MAQTLKGVRSNGKVGFPLRSLQGAKKFDASTYSKSLHRGRDRSEKKKRCMFLLARHEKKLNRHVGHRWPGGVCRAKGSGWGLCLCPPHARRMQREKIKKKRESYGRKDGQEEKRTGTQSQRIRSGSLNGHAGENKPSSCLGRGEKKKGERTGQKGTTDRGL